MLTSCVTPMTLARMLNSSGTVVDRRCTVRPSLRALMMLACAYAAAVMIPWAPARVVRTRAKLYEPREMSFAVKRTSHFEALNCDARRCNVLGSPGSSMDSSLGSR